MESQESTPARPKELSVPKAAGLAADKDATEAARPRKKAAEAAQQLWYEWAAESMVNKPLKPRSARTLRDAQAASRLVQEAERMRAMADARLLQCQTFWDDSASTATGTTATAGSPTSGSKSRCKHELLEGARRLARTAVQRNMQEEGLRAQVGELRTQTDKAAHKHATDLAALAREVETLTERCQLAESALAQRAEQEVELRQTIGLLQQKVLSANEREIEHQRKLCVFTRLEPIFSRLAEQFSFGSPDEVVNRLEFLEHQQMSNSEALAEYQQENSNLKKKVEQFQQEAQAAQVTLASESTRWQTKLERMESDHLAESQSAQDALSKLRDKEGDMLSLQSSVADLWTRCCNNSELVRATDKEEGYLLHEPLEMISALQELLLMHAPTEAGRSNRQLQAYANRVWRTHFKSRPQLKNKTLDIFRALHDYLTASLAAVEEEKAKAARLRKQIKEVKESEDKSVRKMRRTVLHHQKFLDDRRAMIGLPRPLLVQSSVAQDGAANKESTTENELLKEKGNGDVEGESHANDEEPSLGRPVSAAATFGHKGAVTPSTSTKPRPVSAQPFLKSQSSTTQQTGVHRPNSETSSLHRPSDSWAAKVPAPIQEEAEGEPALPTTASKLSEKSSGKPRPLSAMETKAETHARETLHYEPANKARSKRPQTALPRKKA